MVTYRSQAHFQKPSWEFWDPNHSERGQKVVASACIETCWYNNSDSVITNYRNVFY